MKKIVLAGLLSASSIFLDAQTTLFPNGFSNAFNELLKDYPNKFGNVEGALKKSENEYTQYGSWVSIPGSEYCYINLLKSGYNASIFYKEKNNADAVKDYNEFIALFERIQLSLSFKKRNLPGDTIDGEYDGLPVSAGSSPGSAYKKTTFIPASPGAKYAGLTIEAELIAGDWPMAKMVIVITSPEIKNQ